jgi:hypothetical protein
MKKILFLLFLTGIKQINAQVCFNPAVDNPTGSYPFSVISADFNGDGIPDLATTNYAVSKNISILLGTGTGTFGTATNFTVSSGQPAGLIHTDFNSDGKVDLAVIDNTNSSVISLLGTGTGSFTIVGSFSVTTNGYPDYLTCGDFNNDGKADLATADYNTDNISVLLGTGTGSFGTASSYTFATGTGPTRIICGDFNGDGNTDLISSNYTSNLSLLIGTGTGSFVAPVNFGTISGYAIVSGDFNQDGKLDLALPYGANVSILIGIGNGSFGAATNFPVAGANGINEMIKGDFNGDGKVDLAMANENSNNASVILGTGTGSFGASTNFTVGSQSGNEAYSITSSDFNQDGKPDLAVSNYDTQGSVSVLLNNLPEPVVNGNTFICVGNSTTLTASGADTYTWSANAGGGTTASVTLSPTVTTTYSVSGNDAGCSITGTHTVSVIVNPKPTVTANPIATVVCAGTNVTLSGGGAANYVWSGGVINGIAFVPSTTATYTVLGTDANTCTNTAVASVTVNPLPNVQINGMSNGNPDICIGSSILLNASGANTYTWNTSQTTITASHITVTVDPTSYVFNLTGIDVNGCTNSTTITFNINALPTITVNNATICAGTTATLTANGATTYTWSTNATGATITPSPTITTTYTVTGTDVNSCTNTAIGIVTEPANPAPVICMVSTDSTTNYNYNIVYWDKASYANADSFIVYRKDNSSGIYLRIGAVSNDSLSEFVDTAFSIGGPNGGNPQYNSWRYKLAIKDTCGTTSSLSPFHQSVFVTQSGSTFNFSSYIDSGQVNLPTGYALYRDNNNTGNWQLLANVGSSPANDPNYSLYPNGNWRIDALGFTCNPTYRLAGGNNNPFIVRQKSHSNTQRQAQTTNINKLVGSNNQIAIYPNPADNTVNINCAEINSKTIVSIYDATGRIVLQQTCTNGNQNQIIDIQNIQAGVYFIEVVGVRKVLTIAK